jgi:drug/metabolite transporter (DMT)-like permease
VTADLLGPAFGSACALGSALSWTLISLVVRALSPPFTSMSINVIRSALGGVMLAAVVVAWKGPAALQGITSGSYGYLAVSIVIAVGLGDTAFFESTKIIGLARAMTVSMIYPLIAAGLGRWFLDEPITARGGAGALVTLGGLVLIVGERATAAPETVDRRAGGIGLAVLAAIGWAVSVLILKAPLREVDPVTAQAIRLPVATAVLWLTPWGWGTGRILRTHTRAASRLLIALGGLTVLSSVLFMAGLKYTAVGTATVLSSTAPLFALPIGRLAFRERVTWRAVAGAILSVAGIALLAL